MPKMSFPVPVVMKDFDRVLEGLDDIVGENSLKITLDNQQSVTAVAIYPPISVDEIARIQRLAKVFGADMQLSPAEKLAKFQLGTFNVYDLSDSVIAKVKPDTFVIPLRMKKWTKVGGYWMYLSDVLFGPEDCWMDVLVVKDIGLFSFTLMVYKWWVGDVVSLMDRGVVAGTNLIFEMWFVGDSENSVPLLAELAEEVINDKI